MRVPLFHCGKQGKFLRSVKGAIVPDFSRRRLQMWRLPGPTLAGFDPVTPTNAEGEGNG